jgi:aspartate aminotransferase
MLQLSQRGQEIPASPIRKLVPYAEAAKARGLHVYHLNIGQPDIATPRAMLDAFREHQFTVIEYGHSAGLLAYREKLATYYQKHDIDVSADEIIITTGGSEALQFAMLATMDPGDEVIIPEPFYTNYNSFARAANIRVVPLTCRAENGFALPEKSAIKSIISPKTRAIMISNPGNPTGYIYNQREMQTLAEIAGENDLFFMSDEVYREFTYDGRRHHSVLHHPDIYDRAILLDSVSKRYSACGARIGALLSKNADVVDAALRLGQARLCPPTLEQIGAMAAVDTPDSYFSEVLLEYTKRRDTVHSALAKMPGVLAEKPGGAFYLIAKLPIDNADRFCQWLLTDFHIAGETLMLAPAAGFYATPGLGQDEVRIAYVLHVESLEKSMHILSEALSVYPGRVSL